MLESRTISIIIPVFNAESYLERCLNSVLNQSYSKLEIILINDGSTDNSPKICDYYSKKDTRIKVIHKKNAGPSLARKEGIEIASGDYISFVDADDYIDEDMYKILVKEAIKGFDIVECGYREVSIEAELIRERKLRNTIISERFNCALHYASQRNTTNFLWNKLYNVELFKDIKFLKLYAGEDSCILTQVFSKAKQVEIINDTLYNYVMTPDSLCRQPFSEKKLDNIKAGEFMYDFYTENIPELSSFSALHICSYASQLFCKISNENIPEKQEYLEYLSNHFNEYYNVSKNRLTRSMSSKKRIIFVEIFNKNRKIAMLIYKIFG